MIFGLGKKRAEKSFKDRVTEFWKWYPQVAERLFQTIERGDCQALTEEVSEFMANTLPGMAWVFGPGENGGHSLSNTMSGKSCRRCGRTREMSYVSNPPARAAIRWSVSR
jgi:hypothetical protein